MRKIVKRKKTYRVRAADGCKMPLPANIAVIGGGRPQVFTPETIIEVADSSYVRRRIARGDLVEVEAPKPKKER